MSSSTVLPAPVAPAPISATSAAVSVWAAFVKAHETLLIWAACLVLIFVLGNKLVVSWDSHELREDTAASTSTQATLLQQQTTNAQLAQQNVVVQKLIEGLSSQIKTTQNQIIQVPAQIAAVPPDKLQGDIEGKVGGPLLSAPILAKVDTIVTDYPLMQKEIDQVNADIIAQEKSNANLNAQIVGLNSSLVDETNLCVASTKTAVEAQKVADKKRQGFWIKVAIIAAAVIGGAAGHGL